VTVEAGKTPSGAAGEVQEMIDICQLAVGQSLLRSCAVTREPTRF